jgi:hypothetical protein
MRGTIDRGYSSGFALHLAMSQAIVISLAAIANLRATIQSLSGSKFAWLAEGVEGVEGDRFFDYKENYEGQIAFFWKCCRCW